VLSFYLILCAGCAEDAYGLSTKHPSRAGNPTSISVEKYFVIEKCMSAKFLFWYVRHSVMIILELTLPFQSISTVENVGVCFFNDLIPFFISCCVASLKFVNNRDM
jgi:hypothetical protein